MGRTLYFSYKSRRPLSAEPSNFLKQVVDLGADGQRISRYHSVKDCVEPLYNGRAYFTASRATKPFQKLLQFPTKLFRLKPGWRQTAAFSKPFYCGVQPVQLSYYCLLVHRLAVFRDRPAVGAMIYFVFHPDPRFIYHQLSG